ncbi:MAG: ATP-binding protein [Firmicutes bacterium]|nr:ATP-binding protein [Bacillota bacterium]
MFLGRENELNELENLYNQNNFQMVVIYGRRRVGKTALITEFCKNRKSIQYTAIEQNDKIALETFSETVLEILPKAKSMIDVFSSWDKAFEYISEESKNERLILAIDEYPYLASGNPSISSILQKNIDIHFKDTNLFLILCGSSMSFMENQVLGYKSPLYGRRTAQFKIDSFDYLDSSLFFAECSNEDNVFAYSVTGGVPQYLEVIGGGKDIEIGVCNSYFKPTGHLFEEPYSILKQEVREPSIYNSIISSIAKGATRLSEIASKTGEDNRKCLKYIKNLIDLKIVIKETPLRSKSWKK